MFTKKSAKPVTLYRLATTSLAAAKNRKKHRLAAASLTAKKREKQSGPGVTAPLPVKQDSTEGLATPAEKKRRRSRSAMVQPVAPSITMQYEALPLDRSVASAVAKTTAQPVVPPVIPPVVPSVAPPVALPVAPPVPAAQSVKKGRHSKRPVLVDSMTKPTTTSTALPATLPANSSVTPPAQHAKSSAIDVLDTWFVLFLKMRANTAMPLHTLAQYCHEQFWWKSVINNTDTEEHYGNTLHRVLKDGTLTKGQKQVLEVYTRDVCAQHLLIATAVWMMYTENTDTET